MFQTTSTYAPPCIVRKHIFRIIWKRIDRSKIGDSILPDASLVISTVFVPRQLCSLYLTCSELLRALWDHAHRYGRTCAARTCVCACVYARVYARTYNGEFNARRARVTQCRVYGHYRHCATRERMNMCTMHQRVKTQWRTTQTPELRRQSA